MANGVSYKFKYQFVPRGMKLTLAGLAENCRARRKQVATWEGMAAGMCNDAVKPSRRGWGEWKVKKEKKNQTDAFRGKDRG